MSYSRQLSSSCTATTKPSCTPPRQSHLGEFHCRDMFLKQCKIGQFIQRPSNTNCSGHIIFHPRQPGPCKHNAFKIQPWRNCCAIAVHSLSSITGVPSRSVARFTCLYSHVNSGNWHLTQPPKLRTAASGFEPQSSQLRV